MKTFAITGRCLAAPPPADWREQLAQMLGAKPRRIGTWAELGMYGALCCMADAGENDAAARGAALAGQPPRHLRRDGDRAGTVARRPADAAGVPADSAEPVAGDAGRADWNGTAMPASLPGASRRACCAWRQPRRAVRGYCWAGWTRWMAARPTGCGWFRKRQPAEGLQPLGISGGYFAPGLNQVQIGRTGVCSGQDAAFLGELIARGDRIHAFFTSPQLVAWQQ